MGSILAFAVAPSPTLGHGADDRLAAGLHRDVLDPDHLLALTAVAIERVRQSREGAHQLVAVLQPHLPAGEGLLGQGGPTEALQGGLVGRHHLHGQHGLDDVAGADVGQTPRVAVSRTSLASGSSFLPRQTVPSTWLAA